jgi:hypothetical protein
VAWRSKGYKRAHVVVVVETTIFSGEATNSGHKLQKINLNQNAKQGHGNKALVMEIITVPMDLPRSSYIERNVKEKIMVSTRIAHEMKN